VTKAGTKLPFEDSRIAVFLRKQIAALESIKTQREIASEIGYDKPNILSMFKRGEAKIPLEKIPALAKALHVDPAFLFRLAMEQYWPKAEKAIADVFGSIATKNNRAWLSLISEALGEEDPELTPELAQRIRTELQKGH
jgi:transcriptional regulator with XRE-family HTH domain